MKDTPVLTRKEKQVIYNAAYYAANKEKKAVANAAYYAANKERRVAWCEANKESKAAKQTVYRAANPDISRRAQARRRALRLGNGWERYTEQQVLEIYGTDCHICNLPIDLSAPRLIGEQGWENGLHIDHIIPISKGGADMLSNVSPAHGTCNVKKRNKSV